MGYLETTGLLNQLVCFCLLNITPLSTWCFCYLRTLQSPHWWEGRLSNWEPSALHIQWLNESFILLKFPTLWYSLPSTEDGLRCLPWQRKLELDRWAVTQAELSTVRELTSELYVWGDLQSAMDAPAPAKSVLITPTFLGGQGPTL